MIFRGSLEEGLSREQIRFMYLMLVALFGGKYITSNEIECMFGVKSALKPHKTVKNGTRLIDMVLHTKLQLNDMSKDETQEYFKKIITIDVVRKMIIKRDHTTRGEKQKNEQIRDAIFSAYNSGGIIVIHYQDKMKVKTTRAIDINEIETDTYTGVEMINAYCRLRKEERNFRMDRILDAMNVAGDLKIV